MKRLCIGLFLALPLMASEESTLEPRLGLPFRDHAVLQQKIPLPVWGHSLPQAEVTVNLGGKEKTTVAACIGRSWCRSD